jgi:hypothetical protein
MIGTRHAIPAVIGAGLLALAGCTGGGGDGGDGTTAPQSSTPAAPAVSPLTGETPSKNPVIAIKIEDTALGRPQVGTDKADLVYIEQVEGGLTRLLAIFNSSLPTVEPVRSVRPSDPELTLQFGRVIFVASGGSKPGIAPLDKSPLKSVINDRGGAGFRRDPNRAAPENLRANLATIAKKVKGPKATDIGLEWSDELPGGKTKPGTVVRTQVGGTDVEFKWNPKTHQYMRIIDGAIQHTADGAVIDTPNVIVQFCKVTTYTKDRDVLGNPAKYTHTVGTGRAVIFRNGKRIEGTWSRDAVDDGTQLTTSGGETIPLALGGAWFVLVENDAPLN